MSWENNLSAYHTNHISFPIPEIANYQGCLVDSALGDCDCLGQPYKDVQADQDTYCPDMPKGKFLGSRLWCLTVSLLLSHWYPGSGVVLDCMFVIFKL